jgi:serine protease Do
MASRWILVMFLVTIGARSSRADNEPAAPVTALNQLCQGEYADDLSALDARSRAFDRQPEGVFSYCVRNTARYECLSYDPEGNVRKRRSEVVAHGTAFGYRRDGDDTLLLTNEHVAVWPTVTDGDHPVEGVAPGCKKVSETLRIVENEDDGFDRDDILLNRVVSDPGLDVAILRAHAPLHVMDWKIGRSAALRERNVVEVRGFPLGAFRATNVGKVVSAYDHDEFGGWDHDDFIVDALLSAGNSGSPVLAVSCRTGELELVGIYHAGYSRGSALNVVIGIDQVRGLMSNLKREARPHIGLGPNLDGEARAKIVTAAEQTAGIYFSFGSLTALARPAANGSLVYEVFPLAFPRRGMPIALIEDAPPIDPPAFGRLGRVWFGGSAGLRSYLSAELEGEAQAQLARAMDMLRRGAMTAATLPDVIRQAQSSPEAARGLARLETQIGRATAADREPAAAFAELAQHLAPGASDPVLALVDVLRSLGPAEAPSPPLPTPPAAASLAEVASQPRAPRSDAVR